MLTLEQQAIMNAGKVLGCEGEEKIIREKLAKAKTRLEWVQSFGQAYSQIEFSPYVKSLLDENAQSLQEVMAVM